MSNIDLDHILPGETVLWSTYTTSPQEDRVSPEFVKALEWAMKIAGFFVMALWIWTIYKNRDNLKVQHVTVFAIFAVAILIFAWIRKRFGTPTWNINYGPDVFTNAVITDQRVMLENHAEPPQSIEIAKADILSAGLDYEQGGLALKINSRGSVRPAVLIGMTDFRRAAEIIEKRLMGKGGRP